MGAGTPASMTHDVGGKPSMRFQLQCVLVRSYQYANTNTEISTANPNFMCKSLISFRLKSKKYR